MADGVAHPQDLEGSKPAAAAVSQQAPSEHPAGQTEQQHAPAQPAKRTRLTSSRQQQASHQTDAAPPKFTALATRQHSRRHDGNSPAPKKAKALPPAHRLKALQAPADLQTPAEPISSAAAAEIDPRPSPEPSQQADAAPSADQAGPSSSPSDLDAGKIMVTDHPGSALGHVSGSFPAADSSTAAVSTGPADSQPTAAAPTTAAAATARPIVQLDDAAVAEAHVHVPRAQGDGASAELDLEQRLETPSAVQPPVAPTSAAVPAAAPADVAMGPCDQAADAENIPESKPVPASQPGALSGQQTHESASHAAAGVISAASRGLQASASGHGPSSSTEDATGRAGARKAGQPLAELSAAPSEDSQKSSADVSCPMQSEPPRTFCGLFHVLHAHTKEPLAVDLGMRHQGGSY